MSSFIIRNFRCKRWPKNIQYKTLTTSIAVKSDKVPDEFMPKNLLEPTQTTHLQPKGEIYDKRPFKVKLEANKKYSWCTCGFSKSQPFCDGNHKISSFNIKLKPIVFEVAETKDYWLCNCKQSDHRPFCDGTHKNEEIQSKIKNFKM